MKGRWEPSRHAAHRLDRVPVERGDFRDAGEIVFKTQVQNGIGLARAASQTLQVLQRARMRCDAEFLERSRTGFGAGQAQHAVAAREQMGDGA
jgi:hypothetical protein